MELVTYHALKMTDDERLELMKESGKLIPRDYPFLVELHSILADAGVPD